MSSSLDRLHFSRFEFKYLLAAAPRAAVEAELGHFVELDPHASHGQGGQYLVRSLYFDDAVLTAFRDKLDGLHTRSKFRLRTYGRAADDPAPWFLELKGRYSSLVFKHRTRVADGVRRDGAGDELISGVLTAAEPSPVRQEFAFQVHRRRLRPVVLVDYQRRPYVSRFDPDFRLTFDSQLSACASERLYPGPAARWRRLLPGMTVMEVKFRRHVPSWFHRIVQAHELRRLSISKVCTAIQALGIALEPS